LIKIFKNSYVIQNIINLTFSSIVLKFIGFLYVTYFISKFGMDIYGSYILLISYLGVIESFSSFGLFGLIKSKVIQNKKNIQLYNIMIIITFIVMVISIFILFTLKHINIYFLFLFVCFTIVTNYTNFLFFTSQQHKKWAKFQVIQGLFSYSSMFIYLYNNENISVIVLMTIGYIVKLLFLSIFYLSNNKYLTNINFVIRKKYIFLYIRLIKNSGKWLLLNYLVNKVGLNFIPIILGESAGFAFVGIYDVILKIISIFQMPLYTMEQLILTRIKKENIKKIRKEKLMYINLVSILLSLVSIGAVLLYIYIFSNTYFTEEYIILTILFSLTISNLGYRIFHRVYFLINEWTKEMMQLNTISSVFNTGMIILLSQMKYLNGYSVGIVTLITSFLGLFSYQYFYRRQNDKK